MRTLSMFVAVSCIGLSFINPTGARSAEASPAVDEEKPPSGVKSMEMAKFGNNVPSLAAQATDVTVGPSAALRAYPSQPSTRQDAIAVSHSVDTASIAPAPGSGIAPQSKLTISRATADSGVKSFDATPANLQAGQAGAVANAARVRSSAQTIAPAESGPMGRAMLAIASPAPTVKAGNKVDSSTAAPEPIARSVNPNRFAGRDISANVKRAGAKRER
jgi:hypothetical protein